MKFNDWLRKLLEERGLTYEELGELVGVTHSAVGSWVRGKYLPDPTALKMLAKVAGVDDVWLFRMVGYLSSEEGQPQMPESDPQMAMLLQQIKKLSLSERRALAAYLGERLKQS